MKKEGIITLVGLIFVLAPGVTRAEIVVRQEKNGNLTISNKTLPARKTPRVYKKGGGGLTFVPTSPTAAVATAPAKYLAKIKTLAAKHGVKESLIIAVIRAESGFNPHAVSKKGAVGIMQLMPDTARQYGVVNRYNADQNMDAGVRHLKYLYEKYRGNLKLVLAAYNAGEEAVKKYRGIPPYNETRTYVKRVMLFMGMAYDGIFDTKISTKLYQYRTKDGSIMITDTYPYNADGPVTVIE